MQLHRNSQKRYYIPGAIYFITTNTYMAYPYFENDALSELLIHEIMICKGIQNFTLYGYKINPNHIHLLLQPGNDYNISKIMGSIKKFFSRDANYIISMANPPNSEGGLPESAFAVNPPSGHIPLETYVQKILNKNISNPFPKKFKWQLSFHDHIIRDGRDFYNHIRYIERQWVHHGLEEDKWMWVDKSKVKSPETE